jgi:hypothetical protein
MMRGAIAYRPEGVGSNVKPRPSLQLMECTVDTIVGDDPPTREQKRYARERTDGGIDAATPIPPGEDQEAGSHEGADDCGDRKDEARVVGYEIVHCADPHSWLTCPSNTGISCRASSLAPRAVSFIPLLDGASRG